MLAECYHLQRETIVWSNENAWQSFCLEQFRHYLLGHKFLLFTDHSPLQWLFSQKMEGLLARWALAAQEYDFTIRGTENQNTDALSRQFEHLDVQSATTSVTCHFIEDVKFQQHQDPIICQLYETLSHCSMPPCTHTWSRPPLKPLLSALASASH